MYEIDYKILKKIKSLPSYDGIPKDYWILGIQSTSDKFNEFDDTFILMRGYQAIVMTTGTTNAGKYGLKNYQKYNKKGCAVIKTDEWYYDLWTYGRHRGRMRALKQAKPISYYRDSNKNNKSEELGVPYRGVIGINFHTVSYNSKLLFTKRYINGWSTGCQVVNNTGLYYMILDKVKDQKFVTYCLIKDEYEKEKV